MPGVAGAVATVMEIVTEARIGEEEEQNKGNRVNKYDKKRRKRTLDMSR